MPTQIFDADTTAIENALTYFSKLDHKKETNAEKMSADFDRKDNLTSHDKLMNKLTYQQYIDSNLQNRRFCPDYYTKEQIEQIQELEDQNQIEIELTLEELKQYYASLLV